MTLIGSLISIIIMSNVWTEIFVVTVQQLCEHANEYINMAQINVLLAKEGTIFSTESEVSYFFLIKNWINNSIGL